MTVQVYDSELLGQEYGWEQCNLESKGKEAKRQNAKVQGPTQYGQTVGWLGDKVAGWLGGWAAGRLEPPPPPAPSPPLTGTRPMTPRFGQGGA